MKYLPTFEGFINENREDFIDIEADPKLAAQDKIQILAHSLASNIGTGFTPKEFGEYIEDYFKNPDEYDIDTESQYYEAIEAAWNEIADEARRPVWQKGTVERSPIFKAYKRFV